MALAVLATRPISVCIGHRVAARQILVTVIVVLASLTAGRVIVMVTNRLAILREAISRYVGVVTDCQINATTSVIGCPLTISHVKGSGPRNASAVIPVLLRLWSAEAKRVVCL